MQRALLYAVAIVVLLSAAYLVWTKAPRLDEVPMTSPTPSVEMRVVEDQEETDTYTIDVRYPQFGNDSVDAALRQTVERSIAAFKSYPIDEPPIDAIPKNELVVTFNSVHTGSEYVSVGILVSEYTGGAHPNSVIIGVNVDLATGQEVTLPAALALVDLSLEEVAAAVDAELSAKLGDAYFEEGATATPENYATFLIGAEEVTFIFNNYQVAPYAAGPQSVSFPRVQRGY